MLFSNFPKNKNIQISTIKNEFIQSRLDWMFPDGDNDSIKNICPTKLVKALKRKDSSFKVKPI